MNNRMYECMNEILQWVPLFLEGISGVPSQLMTKLAEKRG